MNNNEYLVGVYKEVGKNPDIIKIKNDKVYLEKLLDGEYANQDYDDYTILYKKQNENANSSQIQSNGNRLTKSTAIGRAFDDKEAAYVNVLLLPALVTLIIITILVGYLIFINWGG